LTYLKNPEILFTKVSPTFSCSYFVGVASESLDRNLSISRITGRPQGKDWMCFLPRLPQGRSLRQIAHVHASMLWKITMCKVTNNMSHGYAKRNSSGTHVI
jgi:hypothetical protein